MAAFRSFRNLRGLLLLLLIAVAVVAWLIIEAPGEVVKGQTEELPELPAILAQELPPFTEEGLPPFREDEDQDEIDPEACATIIQKEIEGPIIVPNPILLLDPVPASGVIREQMIVKVFQACNVDDEVRPPNLERDLDVDIEVFSIICEKAVDLSVTARCEVRRVAQDENAPFLD